MGTVADPTGAGVPGANVTLTNAATNVSFTSQSAENGNYLFEAVQAGTYTLSVEAPGFKKFVTTGNLVSVGQPTTVNVTLQVGAVSEQVEVSAAAELVQTSSSGNFGNTLQQRQIKDLPIVGTRGRNPINLVFTQPGVVSGANTGGASHVNGARDRAWNYTLDGLDSNEASFGGSELSPLRVNPDALQEMRILTSNTTAEFGRNSGAQVAMVTRSGGNEFHGTGFWFYRTPRLNANEWESNLNALGKRQLVQNIYGGSIGGPIIKNRTFFFFNTQLLKLRETRQVDRTVLTASARQGILRYVQGGRNLPAGTAGATVDFQGNLIPGRTVAAYSVAANDPQRIGLDPTVQRLLARTPLPNNFAGGDGVNTAFYTFNGISREDQKDFTLKIDHVINERNTIFGRASWGRQLTPCDRANGGQELFPGTGCQVNTDRTPRNFAGNWRWTPTARITNELVGGVNMYKFGFDQPFGNLSQYSLNAPIDLVESTTFGNVRTIRTYQVVDNVSYFRGAHQFKFGTNLRYQQHLDQRGSVGGFNVSPELNFSTTINPVDQRTFGIPTDINTAVDLGNFQSFINLLLGRVGQLNQGFVSNGDRFTNDFFRFDARFGEYDFYVQDTWKVSRNLTIDLGLRWEIKLAPRSSGQQILVPDQTLVAGAPGTTNARWVPGQLFKDRYGNLGPSLGFAWDPFGTGKTSIRSNYRIAYDRMATFLPSSNVFPNLPGATLGVANTDFGSAGGRLANVPALSATTRPSDLQQPIPYSAATNAVFDPNFKIPTTHMWVFSIQREVVPNSVLEVSYLGRRAYHLLGAYNANQAQIFSNGFLDAYNTAKAGGESALLDQLTSADTRRNTGESGAAFVRRLFPSQLSLNSVAAVASSLATRIQTGQSATARAGVSPFYFIPFPQFTGGLTVLDSNDFSTYHGLQTQLTGRYRNGITYQLAYTFSKSLDTRSYDPVLTTYGTANAQTASSTPFDVYNRRLNYARSDFDRTHVFVSNFVVELPFGRGKRFGRDASGLVERIIGGWEVAGIVTLQTGRPFTVYSGSNTFGSVQQSWANCSGCSRTDGSVFDDPQQGLKFYFDEALRGKFSTPAAGTLGNTGRNWFTGPGWKNLDATLMKRTRFRENMNLEIRADMTNLTNTPSFGFPTATTTLGTFGRIRDTVASTSRKIQLGAKFNF